MTIIERRSRLMLALGLFPWLPAHQVEQFHAWLDAQPLAFDDWSHTQLLASASLEQVSFIVDGPQAAFKEVVDAFMEDAQASENEAVRLADALSLMPVNQIGSWLSATADGVDGGWILTTETQPESALPLLDRSDDRARLAIWLQQYQGWTLHQVTRSVGEPTPMTELIILPPDSIGAREGMDMVGELFGQLDLPWLEAEVIEILLEEGALEPALIARFIKSGISRLGLAFGQPARRLTLLLAGLKDEEAHVKLALLEGALRVESPELLSFAVTAAGWRTELLYQL
jgi:hypothetical protein